MTALAATLRLARWLGPWASPSSSPAGIERTTVTSGEYRHDVFRGQRAEGVLVLVPGLHFRGIDDLRFDRFARVLAGSGLLVVGAHVRPFRELLATSETSADVIAAFDAARSYCSPGERPTGMSISFGCLPLIRAAATLGDAVGGLITFGGYGDWRQTMRFALSGSEGIESDPLNRPVVFLNLLPSFETQADRSAVAAAWREYVHATWSKEWGPRVADWRGVGSRIAESLDDEATRELFEVGVGLRPDTSGHIERALVEGQGETLELRDAAACVTAPVRIMHGADDDVIPVAQADALARCFTATEDLRVYRTGAFAHTGGGGAGAMLRDLGTTIGMLRCLAELPRVSSRRDGSAFTRR